jgi:hypothetical protein
VQCGLTSSLGSLCKAALFTPFADVVLSLNSWSNRRPVSAGQDGASSSSLRGAAAGFQSENLLLAAQRHNRLAVCLAAVFGRSYCPTAEDMATTYPESLDICIKDTTSRVLNAGAVSAAGVLATLFGLADDLVTRRDERELLPLIFIVCFFLSYCGISLAIYAYSSAVDALIVSSAMSPLRFARHNQIIFLRFLRNSETGLR